MKQREFVADDVVYSYDLVNESIKRIPTYFDHIKDVVARDEHTVVFYFSEFNAEWAYRFGYGFYSGISPREMENVDRKSWRNVTGTGPFLLQRYVQANAQIYARNDKYWDSERIGDASYQIPFVGDAVNRTEMAEQPH